ncbi:MAG: hypothetical protein U1E52_02240 [Geminicoccaceae bacterium]
MIQLANHMLAHDSMIDNPSGAQSTFDASASTDKELRRVAGTTKRFEDGYNWFGRQPANAAAAACAPSPGRAAQCASMTWRATV